VGVEPPTGTPPPPPRPPRPGDPFARPARPRPTGPARKRRRGRNFFLFLLVSAGLVALASMVLFMGGRGMIIGFYEDVVVPRGVPEALPPDYPREDAERLVKGLHAYFVRADEGEVSDDDVIRVISAIENAMKDEHITPEEAAALLDLTGGAGGSGEGG
jgi:hypothetical protein